MPQNRQGPLGLSAGNIASESGSNTSLSAASEAAMSEKAEVPKLESAARGVAKLQKGRAMTTTAQLPSSVCAGLVISLSVMQSELAIQWRGPQACLAS